MIPISQNRSLRGPLCSGRFQFPLQAATILLLSFLPAVGFLAAMKYPLVERNEWSEARQRI